LGVEGVVEEEGADVGFEFGCEMREEIGIYSDNGRFLGVRDRLIRGQICNL
jgi:hypothetical protein